MHDVVVLSLHLRDRQSRTSCGSGVRLTGIRLPDAGDSKAVFDVGHEATVPCQEVLLADQHDLLTMYPASMMARRCAAVVGPYPLMVRRNAPGLLSGPALEKRAQGG